MYLTISPLIISGVLNMVFTKTTLYKKHNTPIDSHKLWKDGKRILGDNKTWIGFYSMIAISVIVYLMSGALIKYMHLSSESELYVKYKNTSLYNALLGLASGFIYMISELPNSFIKRRLDIPSGKTEKSLKGACFFVIDQIDSLIGIAILLYVITDISVVKALGYLCLGAVTHITINIILHKLKIRKNI